MPSVNLLKMDKDVVTDRLNSSFRTCSDVSGSIGDNLSLRNNSMNFNSFSNSLDTIGSSSNGNINYSAFVSPCQNSKLSFNLSNSSTSHLIGSGDFRSLQNSPFYNHYPGNTNNLSEVESPNNNLYSSNSTQNSTHKNISNGQVNSIERILKNGGPQRELFTQSLNSSGLRYQDRLYYYSIAQSQGYIVGLDLERIKENSRRSMSQTYGRISAYFRNRYGETEAKTKASYLQLGVRVPSKDHVSEIVGKGGQKIKLIREETGALITTPGENEEHVFIIEAPPEIALNVANHLTKRAHEITQSKLIAGDRRRGSAGNATPGSGQVNGQTNGQSQCFSHNLVGCPVCVNSIHNSISQNSLPNSPANNNGLMNGSSLLATRASNNNLSITPSNGTGNGTTLTNGTMNCDNCNSSSPPPNSLSNLNFVGTTLNSGNGSSNTITNCVNNMNNGQVGSQHQANGINGNTTITSTRILLARGRISVPQDMVGKIIGTQGSIITTIQKDTGTEIKSPPKEAGRGPDALADFEISAYQGLGLTSAQAAECRVQQAKQLIGHLVMRQLERRTSDDIDEMVLTPGSDRHLNSVPNTPNNNNHNSNTNGTSNNNLTSNGTSSNNNGNIQNIGWMWPDVAQMDSNEAREVLDRILAESKSKTRRVKEVGGSVANTSPNDCFANPNGSSLNGTDVWIQNAVAAAASNTNSLNCNGGSNSNLPSLVNGNGSQRYADIPLHSLHYKSSLPSSPLRSSDNQDNPFSNHHAISNGTNSVLNRYYMQSPGNNNGNSLLIDPEIDPKNSNFGSLEPSSTNFLDNDFARLWNSMGLSSQPSSSICVNNNTTLTNNGSSGISANGTPDDKPRPTNINVGAIGDGRRRSTPPSSEQNYDRNSNSTSTSSSLGDPFANHQMYINSTNNTANSVLSKLFLQSPPLSTGPNSGTNGNNGQDYENSPNDYDQNCVLIQF